MTLFRSAAWPRLLAAGVLGLALLGTAGCKKGRATVKGKVTFMDQPLVTGTVNFVTSDKRTGSAVITNGEYTMTDAPVGDAKVFVSVPNRMMGRAGGGMGEPPPGVGKMKPPEGMAPTGPAAGNVDPSKIHPIPDKYKSPDTTPLSCTVKRGENSFDIRMTP